MKKGIAITGLLFLLSAPVLSQPDSTGGFFQSGDGTRIYYEMWGHGPAVVLVHGFTNTGASWKHAILFQRLLAAGYSVITVDLRGNGRSDKPHEASAYAHDAEAKDIIGLLDSLEIKTYTPVGYSRGSIITARLLVLDPRIQRAVLGGMGDDFTNPEWPRRVLFYRVLAGDTSVPELEPLVRRIETTGIDRTAMALSQKEQPATSVAELGKMRQPVLVLCGADDADNGSAEQLARLLPGGVYQSVPGKHNGTNNTEAFANAVLAFLERK